MCDDTCDTLKLLAAKANLQSLLQNQIQGQKTLLVFMEGYVWDPN